MTGNLTGISFKASARLASCDVHESHDCWLEQAPVPITGVTFAAYESTIFLLSFVVVVGQGHE